MCIIWIPLFLSLSLLSLLFLSLQNYLLYFQSLSLSILIKFFTLLSHYATLSLIHSLSLTLSLSLYPSLFDYSSNFLITSQLNLHLKGQSQTANIERIPRASSTETNCVYPAKFAWLGMLGNISQHTHGTVKVSCE